MTATSMSEAEADVEFAVLPVGRQVQHISRLDNAAQASHSCIAGPLT